MRRNDEEGRVKQKASGWTGRFLIFFCFSLLLVSAGCQYLPVGLTSVKDILKNPAAYDGRQVKVKGTVSGITKIPLIDEKFYLLSDGGAQIAIVTNANTPPANSKVIVIGRVENVAILNNQGLGLHIRELKRIDHPLF
jgi:hypothetical protein